ncbi:MAG: hypothetical protein V4683_10910 [Bacteroidota bacterium]
MNIFDLLNPCQYDFAWWQQLIMLAIPFVLGLVWPKASSNNEELVTQLAALDAELAECNSKPSPIKKSLETSPISLPKADTIATKSKKDDLKVVEGIGPKIEELFNNAGILSFEQLANTSATRLKEILEAAGSRFQMHDPTTWPAQSKLADEGKWEELKKWQDELNKGIV